MFSRTCGPPLPQPNCYVLVAGYLLPNRTLKGSEWSVVAHRTLALEDRAVNPKKNMEGLLSATALTFRMLLEFLCGALLVIAESLRHIPGLHAYLREILICSVAVVVSLIVKKWHT